MATGFRLVNRNHEVHTATPRLHRTRRSYEAEDVDIGRQAKDEKDRIINELQDHLESLQKSTVHKNPISRTKLQEPVARRGTGLAAAKGVQRQPSRRGMAATVVANAPSVRCKASVAVDAKCERASTVTSTRPIAADDHVRRLTNELAKLQADYARVRAMLQTTSMPTMSSRPITPLLLGDVNVVSATDGTNGRSTCETSSEHENFRREIFRLKEDLLVVRQKMTINLEEKSAALDELSLLKEDHLKRETELLGVISQRECAENRLRLTVEDLERQLTEAKDARQTLQKRVKESEREAAELKEFLHAEHESLSDGLREAEDRLSKQVAVELQLTKELKSKDERIESLTKAAERSQARVHLLEAEMQSTRDKARDLLLKKDGEFDECGKLVEHICRLLNVRTGAVAPSSLVSAILEAETAGCNIPKSIADGDGFSVSKLKAIERAVTSLTDQLKSSMSALETKEAERLALDTDLFTTINRANELEGEMMVLATERQRLADENDILRTQLRDSQNRSKELWHNLGERLDADHRVEDLLSELDREQRTLRKVRADNAEMETLLNEAVANVPCLRDEVKLRRQIATLRAEVLDKHDEVDATRSRHESQCRVLMDNLSKAEAEIYRLKTVIDSVLAYLKMFPRMVRADVKLQKLWKELTGGEEFVDCTETDGK